MYKKKFSISELRMLIISFTALLSVGVLANDIKSPSEKKNTNPSVAEQIIKKKHDQRIFVSMNAIVVDEKKLGIGMEGVVDDAYPRRGTKTHFWSRSESDGSLFVLEQYANEEALVEHVMGNPPARAIFFESIEVVDITIYGKVSDNIKAMFSSLNPKYMDYFGGYSK